MQTQHVIQTITQVYGSSKLEELRLATAEDMGRTPPMSELHESIADMCREALAELREDSDMPEDVIPYGIEELYTDVFEDICEDYGVQLPVVTGWN
jgi:hypothetical protein